MTERRTVDTINDDQLSQLYDDLDRAETENAELRDALAHCHEREPRQRAEAAIERVRALHVPRGNGTCAARCYSDGMAPEQHPCPTIRALDEPAKD